MDSQNFQIELAQECIKGTSRFAETVYHNVCTGAVYSVPNGFWDYALVFTVCAFLAMVGVILFMIFVGMIFNWWNNA